MALGLIPDCDLAKVAAAGNAAGTGARIALLNLAARGEIEDVVRRIEKIETAIEPRFQEHFVAAMALPNKMDAFPNLAKAITCQQRTRPPGAKRDADAGDDSGVFAAKMRVRLTPRRTGLPRRSATDPIGAMRLQIRPPRD